MSVTLADSKLPGPCVFFFEDLVERFDVAALRGSVLPDELMLTDAKACTVFLKPWLVC